MHPYGYPTGTTTEYEEGIDIDQNYKVNGGAPGASLTDGGVASIEDHAPAGARTQDWLRDRPGPGTSSASTPSLA